MKVNVEEDSGHRVALWLVPTNPAHTPRIVVVMNGRRAYELEANVMRPEFKEHGLHGSGQVGFDLTEENVPGISSTRDFAIHEAPSDLLVYRRQNYSGAVEGRLFVLETQARRNGQCDEVFGSRFLMAYSRLEQLPAETITTILRMTHASSLYASGRLPVDPIEDILRRQGFRVAMRINDPMREMYDRLLMLTEPEAHAEILSTLMPPGPLTRVSSRLKGIPIRQLDEVGRIISRLDAETISHLADPLTRQLVSAPANQPLPRDAAKAALMRIAEFDIVAMEDDLDGFFEIATAVMNVDPPFEAPEVSVAAAPAPSILRRQDWFVRLVRNDMAVYDAAKEAAASVDAAAT